MSRFRYLGEANILGRRGGKQNLDARVAGWQNAQSTLIHAGGLKEAEFVATGTLSTGVTVIDPLKGFRQTGNVIGVRLKLASAISNKTAKFKVFRYNAGLTRWDFVDERTVTGITGGNNAVVSLTFATPMAVQEGDTPGIYTDDANLVKTASVAGFVPHSVAGDITTFDAFTATGTRTNNIDWLMYAPYLAVTGDSIAEGHNVAAVNNHGGMHTALAGAITMPQLVATADISAQLKALIGGGSILKYQNLALGSQTFAWIASTGIVEAIAVKPNTIIVHCGSNDVGNDRAWADVDADLDTVMAAVNAASPKPKLLIDEILPWTDGDDAHAAVLRTFNANIAAWCAANGATLIKCHDEMGQVRVATGELDDLLAAYDYDGVHLTAAGVVALAQIWKRYL